METLVPVLCACCKCGLGSLRPNIEIRLQSPRLGKTLRATICELIIAEICALCRTTLDGFSKTAWHAFLVSQSSARTETQNAKSQAQTTKTSALTHLPIVLSSQAGNRPSNFWPSESSFIVAPKQIATV